MSSIRIKLAVIVTVITVVALPIAASAATGFLGPVFGIATAPNGDILAADAGAGITTIRKGVAGTTIALPGVTDVAPIGKGSLWALTAGQDPETDSGQGLHRVSKGSSHMIANLFAFENTSDPDGAGVDSNPFDVASLGGNAALVVDAGGNDLLRVSNKGKIDVLAVFPDELVSTENLQELVGCSTDPIPDFAFICGVGDFMPAQAVPTSVAVGPDGYYYVGELKGFPAPTGASSIWRVAPGASWAECGSSPDCIKVFDGGFTSIIDLAFGPDGRLYVAELDEASWAAVEIFDSPAGGTINACNLSTLVCEVIASDIPVLTSITFGKDGKLWVAKNALEAAEVVPLP